MQRAPGGGVESPGLLALPLQLGGWEFMGRSWRHIGFEVLVETFRSVAFCSVSSVHYLFFPIHSEDFRGINNILDVSSCTVWEDQVYQT